MPIRKLRLPEDMEEMIEMLPTSFQYPENPEWSVQEDERESLEDSIRSLQKNWWLFQIGQFFIPSMRDVLTGFAWEEDSKMAGCAILQPRGQSSQWMIGTIATRPEYRRRGIARQLVSASLDFIRQKQGTVAVLSVIEGNTPAYTLYQKMGMEPYAAHYDIELKPADVHPMPEIPAGFQLEPSRMSEWKPRFELSKRITPESLQKYEPVDKKRFIQPLFIRLLIPILNRAEKIREEYLLIRDTKTGQLAGYIFLGIRQGGSGRHRFQLTLDPAYYADAQIFLEYILHRLTSTNPELIIESGISRWQGEIYEAAKKLGFSTRLTYHRMGIILA